MDSPIAKISIHALLAESDLHNRVTLIPHQQFLSTLSLRRATTTQRLRYQQISDFYPRSPCGERLVSLFFCTLLLYFYPRSPCGERLFLTFLPIREVLFLSTLSLRRATSISPAGYPMPCISIHALLAESDGIKFKLDFINQISIHALLAESDHFEITITDIDFNFYPRSPCGERRKQSSHHK